MADLTAAGADDGRGPTLCYLGHVDTVLADPSDWAHDPWSGDVIDGFLWGRGSLDMKSQVAAEAVAAANLARGGWRPRSGTLKLVFVSDEETGGDVGAHWLTDAHPDRVRCDMLLNEGGGEVFEFEGKRRYGVCCAEKGIFRFKLTARGAAGHASLPKTGDNALLKLAPVLARIAAAEPTFELTEAPAALLRGLDARSGRPRRRARADRRGRAPPPRSVRADARRHPDADHGPRLRQDQRDPRTRLPEDRLPGAARPGRGRRPPADRATFWATPRTSSRSSSPSRSSATPHRIQSPLMDAIDRWVRANDPGAETVPLILPGFSDSRWFRDQFPECVAYGFFPQRHQTLLEAAPLVHNADERIDVRDLGFAAACYSDLARELLDG